MNPPPPKSSPSPGPPATLCVALRAGRGRGKMKTHLKKFQRELRKNMPLPEVILWRYLKNKQMGVKFRRQYTIGNYILDFYAPKIKLAIEIDGDTHYQSPEDQEKDRKRDEFLQSKGIKVLRFLNPEVMRNLDGVLETIFEEVQKRK